MPTNLPPEYYNAEERYRAATTPEERVTRLEEMLSTVPKHKGTDHLRADLRRKLSQLKEEARRPRQTAARQVSPFQIDREGAGQVVLIGPPNSGKSTLVRALTNAEPEVGPAPYTTWTPTPGMMEVGKVQIQLIDTPPLTAEYIEPQMPFLVVVNKCDEERWDEEFEVFCELLEEEWPTLAVSAEKGRNLDTLKWTVFERLDIIRVYSKPPRQEADMNRPFVLHRGSTIEAFAGKVHKDFLEQLTMARVWGEGVYDGQTVSRDHVLHDGDVVELHI